MILEDLDTQHKQVNVLPLLKHYIDELGIYDLFNTHMPLKENQEIPTAQVLCVLIQNLATAAKPLYHVSEWAANFTEGGSALDAKKYNDDRLARALDTLSEADKHALLAALMSRTLRLYEIEMERFHYDTTSLTLMGAYHTPDGDVPVPKRGYNKDHRPDCKQLVFGLTTTADGHVPVNYTVFSGNQADSGTYQPTWEKLRESIGHTDFIFVGDSKLSDMKTLIHIAGYGGRFITIMARTRLEAKAFYERLRKGEVIEWQPGYQVEDSRKKGRYHHYQLHTEEKTREGYRIIWTHSSSRAEHDHTRRQHAIDKASYALNELAGKLNRQRLKTEESIQKAINKIVTPFVKPFITVTLKEEICTDLVKIGRGRKGPDSIYEYKERIEYHLQWQVNATEVEKASRCDGIFPLVDNTELEAVEALKYYKDQPMLEKRNSNLKSVLEVTPMFLKKTGRIDAMLFLHFVTLMLVTLIERNLRKAMEEKEVEKIKILKAGTTTKRPTWNNLRTLFDGIGMTIIFHKDESVKTAIKNFNTLHKRVLMLLEIPFHTYSKLQEGWWDFSSG